MCYIVYQSSPALMHVGVYSRAAASRYLLSSFHLLEKAGKKKFNIHWFQLRKCEDLLLFFLLLHIFRL